MGRSYFELGRVGFIARYLEPGDELFSRSWVLRLDPELDQLVGPAIVSYQYLRCKVVRTKNSQCFVPYEVHPLTIKGMIEDRSHRSRQVRKSLCSVDDPSASVF